MNPMQQVVSTMEMRSTSNVAIRQIAKDCAGLPGEYNIQQVYKPTGWGFNIYALWMTYITSASTFKSPPWLFSGSEVSDAISEATTQCLANRGSPGKSNLWESVAEAHKSVGLISDLLDSAKKVLSNGGLLHKAKASGSAFLLLRYGLGPLISDISSVQQGLAKELGKVRLTSRGFVTSNRNSTSTRVTPYSTLFTFKIQDNYSESLVIRAMSIDELVATTASNIGFSTKGLITLPWELIPYSFVVDWFANLGDYLNALVPLFGVKQLGSCVVLRREFSVNSLLLDTQPTGSYTLDQPLSGSMNWTHKETTRIPTLGGPKVVIKSNFRFDTVPRVLDSVSLILQRLG